MIDQWLMATQIMAGTKRKTRRGMEKAINALIAQRLDRFVQLVIRVSSRDHPSVKEIHNLRTEARRSVATIRLFQDDLPSKQSRQLREQIDQVRRKAGAARDLDVLISQLKNFQSTLPESIVTDLIQRAEKEREKKAVKCVRCCQKMLKHHFQRNDQSLSHRWHAASSDLSVGERIWESIADLQMKFGFDIDALVNDKARRTDDLYHRVRIQARKLRYTLEAILDFVSETPANDIRDVIDHLSSLQDSLGLLHDEQKSIEFLESAASASEDATLAILLREAMISIQKKLHAGQQQEAEHLVQVRDELGEFLKGIKSHILAELA